MNASDLGAWGLNLQAVIPLDELSRDVLDNFKKNVDIRIDSQSGSVTESGMSDYSHLLLVGHAGREFWAKFTSLVGKPKKFGGDPIDGYTVAAIKQFLDRHYSNLNYRVVYPGGEPVDLPALGEHCGWHHSTPMWIGINQEWGTWFAYRALILIDRAIDIGKVSQRRDLLNQASPCDSCVFKSCIKQCPPKAVSEKGLDIEICGRYRLQKDSVCKKQCVARLSCPVASEHRYEQDQVEYHYGHSLKTLREYFKSA